MNLDQSAHGQWLRAHTVDQLAALIRSSLVHRDSGMAYRGVPILWGAPLTQVPGPAVLEIAEDSPYV